MFKYTKKYIVIISNLFNENNSNIIYHMFVKIIFTIR